MDFTISVMIMDMCIKSTFLIVYLEGGNFLFLIFYFRGMLSHFGQYVTFFSKTNKRTNRNWSIVREVVYVDKWQDFQVFEILTHRKKKCERYLHRKPKLQNIYNVIRLTVSSSEKKNSKFLTELLYLQMLYIFKYHYSKVKDEIVNL